MLDSAVANPLKGPPAAAAGRLSDRPEARLSGRGIEPAPQAWHARVLPLTPRPRESPERDSNPRRRLERPASSIR